MLASLTGHHFDRWSLGITYMWQMTFRALREQSCVQSDLLLGYAYTKLGSNTICEAGSICFLSDSSILS